MHAHVGSWLECATLGDYAVTRLPSVCLIDPEGKVVAADLGGREISAAVKNALQR